MIKKIVVTALIFQFAGCSSTNKLLNTAPKINISEYSDSTYYEVGGVTFDSVLADIGRNCPVIGAKKVVAKTRFNYTYNFRTKGRFGSGAGQKIAQVNISMYFNFTFPRWLDYDTSSEKMRSQWDSYLERLKMHETTHMEIYQNAFYDLDAEIYDMWAETAESVERQLKALLDEKLNLAAHLNEEFHNRDILLNNFNYLLFNSIE